MSEEQTPETPDKPEDQPADHPACPRCLWDTRVKTMKPSDEDVQEFCRRSISLPPQAFSKTYPLFGGAVQLRLTSLTEEDRKLYRRALNLISVFITPPGADGTLGIRLSMERQRELADILAALLHVADLSNGGREVMPGWGDMREQLLKGLQKFDNKDTMEVLLEAEKVYSTLPSIYTDSFRQCQIFFSSLIAALDKSMYDKSFWAGVGF